MWTPMAPIPIAYLLVLVRRRGNAFDAVIQALKHAGIPVAGADRLKLTEHIAIIDAILARDPDAAEATTRAHLSGIVGVLRGMD